ncbi:AEC family transporter [Clostridium sp. 19966]|uniref:AEC family transporter n=1 Tax=Clostridium sp. 19966 TaxID=2768166 RepID=UPI0028DE1333|nr:AEC family transporter [Clostridium sp. 19966]MDT8715092.1 AEC family transporter [Clostridium sp. 19966]
MNILAILTKIATNASIVGAIASSILIILLGFFLRKKEVFNKNTSKILSGVVLSAALPALAFDSFMQDINNDNLRQGMNLLFWGIAVYIILIAVTKVIYLKFKGEKKEVLRVLTIFGSTTFFGIPITQAVYGAKGVMYASIFNIAYRIFLYSYAYMKMSGMKMDKNNIKKMISNPIIIATFLGLFVWVFQKSLPQISVVTNGKAADYAFLRIDKTAIWLYTPLSYLEKLCSPLAWLSIGATLAEISLKQAISSKESWYYSFMKVVIVPVINIVILYFLNVTGILHISQIALATVVIAMATPTATVAAAYSISFDKEAVVTSNCSFLSTIFSIVCMPIWIIVLEVIKQLNIFS